MGRKKPTPREESGGAPDGRKSKKKTFVVDYDENSIGTELSEYVTVQEEKVVHLGNIKKGKKGGSNSVFNALNFGLLEEEGDGDYDDDGRKNEEEDGEEEVLAFVGKKKPSKSKKGGGRGSGFSSAAFGALTDEEDEKVGVVDDEEDDPVIAFSGKKKPSNSKKSGGSVSSAAGFDVLGEGENKDNDKNSKEEDEDLAEITFAGKKKASGNSFNAAFLHEKNDEDTSVSKLLDDLVGGGSEDQEEDASALKFSGKEKSSKKKSNNALENGNASASSEVIKSDQPSVDVISKKTTEYVAETSSKNKKKKKKGGKTGQDEDDLDKILAELGGAPPVSKPISTTAAAAGAPPPGENAHNQSELEEAACDKEHEEGPAESLASKKKKKKKEKEREKKVTASPAPEEMTSDFKNKVPDKKVPKHVREMQERLAKLKEAEQRKKRDEEEKLMKEEEERLRQEELERQAEEKKRLKKEREKEKLLKKKQEGKLLTGRQKEEARRLEAMRKQILANAGSLQLPTGESAGAPVKRPLYQKKKSKPQAQFNGAAPADVDESTDSKEVQQERLSEVEAENIEEAESLSTKDKSEVTDGIEDEQDDEGDDDDEEWEAKSWDDADLKLPSKSAFSEEEVDSEPEKLVELRNARTANQDDETKPVDMGEKVVSNMTHRSQNLEAKKKGSEAEGIDDNSTDLPINPDKNNKKKVKEETTKPGDPQYLRSPICCIMGHVDAGKTKLLDHVRGSNIQQGEAGGITQQIGATYIPAENIREITKELKADATLNVPGLLVIDTPGHESFKNLRCQGSGLCDIAVLVVDIMHGLQPQTIESLNLLRMRSTEFIVALNKVDRLYGWKSFPNVPMNKAIKLQSKDVQMEFNTRVTDVITQFKEQGLNTELYYKNKDMGETSNIVPTSAISGQGIPDLLFILVQFTQKTMIRRLTYRNEVQCTVLEVKVIEGHGTTIDVILVNGVLHEGDQIVVCGWQEPIVTSIRALLTPHPMKELRVKSHGFVLVSLQGTYIHHKEIKATQCIKITAQGLEHAIAGSSLYVVGPDDDVGDIKDSAMEDMKSVRSRIDRSGVGVYVQASTLGSLEALLVFLESPAVRIPVSGTSIGPVHKKDVMKASVMLEKNNEYGTILAFDVKVAPEARELADELGVRIFSADIIYHLFDQFKAYVDNLKEEKKKDAADKAVFPCVLKIKPNCVYNKKGPIILGVDVLEGTAKIGTPLCVPQKDFIDIGRIASIEINHKPVDFAKKGQEVAIKIIGSNSEEQQKMFGRHFEMDDELLSKISRDSIDALKEYYKEDLSVEVKRLLQKLKKIFKIA
ncbi:hypothetical protein ACJIZ3_005844 [Penstemon smallii]|uniref:Eukaryotic translation initiation factor 5B n=1 Tax=Penstemon smallii TaxID=265156 RepID=A0ABD3S614_9LAMI